MFSCLQSSTRTLFDYGANEKWIESFVHVSLGPASPKYFSHAILLSIYFQESWVATIPESTWVICHQTSGREMLKIYSKNTAKLEWLISRAAPLVGHFLHSSNLTILGRFGYLNFYQNSSLFQKSISVMPMMLFVDAMDTISTATAFVLRWPVDLVHVVLVVDHTVMEATTVVVVVIASALVVDPHLNGPIIALLLRVCRLLDLGKIWRYLSYPTWIKKY